MNTNKWKVPVTVIGGNGQSIDVTSARQAAELLIIHWPDRFRNGTHVAAQVACLDALEGKQDPEHARQAFEEAARRAGILVEDPPS